jgi:Bacterial capsule synthesis protein PGA_cap
VRAPDDALAFVRDVARAIDPDEQLATGDDDLRVDDTRFEAGDALEVRYEADQDDLERILRSVRLGAQHADLLVVTVHAHEEGVDAATPPVYLQDFARSCVDAGAAAFVGHGVHRLWPVEIHRGAPICYGIGNFAFSDVQEPLHEAMHRSVRAKRGAAFDAATATDADVNQAALGEYFDDDRYFRSVIVELTFADEASTTRLIPLDLRRVDRLTVRGVPQLADDTVAAEIWKSLDAMSAPFGTAVTADGRVTARTAATEDVPAG